MKSTVTKGEKSNEMILELEVSVEEMELPLKQKTKEYAKKVNIPGFRKGKVPDQVVSGFVGIEVLMGEVADDFLAEEYEKAVKEHDLEPIAQPRVNVEQLEKGKPVKLKAIIPVKPQVQLGKYKGIEVTKNVYVVSDPDIEQYINSHASKVAKIEPVEGDVLTANGHIVNINFTGYVDGKKFQGGAADNYPLELGSNTFIPGFEEQLLGMRIDEEKDIFVNFPADYAEPSLAGKETRFTVKICSVKERKLPEINDDLVKELSEESNTVAEWREEIRAKIQEEADADGKDSFRNHVVTLAVNNCEAEIPFLMSEQGVSSKYEELAATLEAQGSSLQEYLKHSGMGIKELREQFRYQTELDIKCELMLEAIAKAENIAASEEEAEKEIKDLADKKFQQYEEYKQHLINNDQIKYIYSRIKMDKAIELIIDNAVVTVEEFDSEKVKKMEAEAAAEALKENSAEAESADKTAKPKSKSKPKVKAADKKPNDK